MNKPTFFEGVVVALIAGISITATVYIINRVFSSTGLFQLLITVISFVYIGYLVLRSRERLGRLTVMASWIALTSLSWIFAPSLLLYALLQLGMIWLVRSLYYYNSVLAALADMGLTGLSIVVALWAWLTTHSLFLAIWCFFLTQALFVLIPSTIAGRNCPKKSRKQSSIPTVGQGDRFENAYYAAENAVKKLSTIAN